MRRTEWNPSPSANTFQGVKLRQASHHSRQSDNVKAVDKPASRGQRNSAGDKKMSTKVLVAILLIIMLLAAVMYIAKQFSIDSTDVSY